MLSRDSPAEFSEPVEGDEGVELKVLSDIIQGVSKKTEFSRNQLWQIKLLLVRNPFGIFYKSL